MKKLLVFFFLASPSWAVLSSKVGTFSLNTSPGNQSVTGLGFQPKAILFWGAGTQTVSGSQANARVMFGMATDSGHRGVLWDGSANNHVASLTSEDWQFTRCISFWTENGATPTMGAIADFVSNDSDGFTVAVTTGDGVAYMVNYLAIGGSSLTNALVSSATISNTTGLKTLTALPFAPDAIITLNNSRKAAFATISDATMSLGFVDLVSTNASSFQDPNAAGTTTSNFYQRNRFVVGMNGAVLNEESTHVSFDSGGETANYTTAPGGNRLVIYLALKGASVANGTFQQPTSNGNSQITGLSFRPASVFFVSADSTPVTAVTANARFSLGSMDENGHQASSWLGMKNGVTTTNTSSDVDTTKTIKMMTEGGASPTVNASASYTSMNSDGFTVTWGTTDASAREVIYWAIGPGTAPATSATPLNRGLSIQGGRLSIQGGKLTIL